MDTGYGHQVYSHVYIPWTGSGKDDEGDVTEAFQGLGNQISTPSPRRKGVFN